MGNRIILAFNDFVNFKPIMQPQILIFPLMDDITLDITSEFESLTEMFSILGDIANFVSMSGKINTATGGKLNKSQVNLLTMFSVPMWKQTNPLKIATKLMLYTKDDAKKDVYDQVLKLVSLSILSEDNEGRFIVPGIYTGKLSQVTADATKKEVSPISVTEKVIKCKIPGIVYLRYAFIKKAVPTFSKEIDEKQYPLWATVDIEIESLYPATTEMLNYEKQEQEDKGVQIASTVPIEY